MANEERLRVIIDALNQTEGELGQLEDNLKGIDEKAKEAGAGLDELSGGTDGLIGSLADVKAGFDMAFGAAQTVMAATQQVLDATVMKAAAWGDEMGDLAQLTGTTVRETSELAATLELMGIKQDGLTKIVKAFTDQGLQPTVANIKDLARQYQAIQDPVEKNAFLFERFGRQASDMAEVMGKLPEEFDALALAARTSGKIMDEEAAAAAEKFNVQLAIMQQRMEGTGIAAGSVMIDLANKSALLYTIPGLALSAVVTKAENVLETFGFSIEQQDRKAQRFGRTMQDVGAAARAGAGVAGASLREMTDAMMALDDPMAVYSEFAPAAYEAAAAARQHRDDVLVLGAAIDGPLKKADEEFAARQADLTQKAKDYQVEIDNLSGKTYLTDAQREQLDEAKAGLDDTNLALEANAAKHEEASKRIIFSLLQQQAAADGLTQKELEGLLLVAQNWGMIDEKTATATQDISRNLENLANNGDVEAFARNIEIAAGRATGALNSIPRSIDINVNMRGAENLVGVDFGSTGRRAEARASGGAFSSGDALLFNEHPATRPEVIIANQSGGGYVLTQQQAERAAGGAAGVGITGNTIIINANTYADGQAAAAGFADEMTRRALVGAMG